MSPPIGADELAQIKGLLADLEPGPAQLPPPAAPVESIEKQPAAPAIPLADSAPAPPVAEPAPVADTPSAAAPFGDSGQTADSSPFGEPSVQEEVPFGDSGEADDNSPFGEPSAQEEVPFGDSGQTADNSPFGEPLIEEVSPEAPFGDRAAPVADIPTAAPFADVQAATPLTEDPFSEQSDLPPAPVAGGPFADSATEVPLAEPAVESPFTEPASPFANPVVEAPFAEPAAEAPSVQPSVPFADSEPAPSPFADPTVEAPSVEPSVPFANSEPVPSPFAEPVIEAPQSEGPFAGLDPTDRSLPDEPVVAPFAAQVPAVGGSEPVDILYAIAEQGNNESGTAAETVRIARQEARQERPSKGLIHKSANKVKFEALPFDSIVPGHPLVIASYSPSGGTGKSSTAMNLGICMATVAQNMAKQKGPDARIPRVLTLDGDIVMGSLSLRLTSKVSPNLYDLQQYMDKRKAAGFTGPASWPSSFDAAPPGEEPMYKFTHWPDNPSNFSVLAAPAEPRHFWHFGPAHYKEILQMLGKFYDVIIIDCGTELVLDSQRAWLSHANEVFLITSPDSDRLYNCSKAARHIASSNPHPQDRRGENAKLLPPLVTREKLSLVVTRSDSDSGLKLDRVVDTLFPWLDESQKFWIPDVSAEMTKANNTGHFLVTENQDYAKVINQMAKHAFHRYVTARSQHGLPAASDS